MKNILLVFISILSLTQLNAQNDKLFFDHIVKAEYVQASSFLGSELNLSIEDFDKLVSKKVAIDKIKSFFDQHKAISYSIKHSGKSKGGSSSYYVVDLRTSTKVFRLFTYLDKVGSEHLITELRIE